MKISDYLDAQFVAFLDVSTRDEAIDALIDLLRGKKSCKILKGFAVRFFIEKN